MVTKSGISSFEKGPYYSCNVQFEPFIWKNAFHFINLQLYFDDKNLLAILILLRSRRTVPVHCCEASQMLSLQQS